MFRLEKKKIFHLYTYYLLEEERESLEENKEWWFFFLKEECLIKEKISKKLKESWFFFRLPPLERAIMMYAAFEIKNKKNNAKIILDQTINFSKVYLEKDKYRYINKVLDIYYKELEKEKIIESHSPS